jgi:tripartite-type tricarboxylate transporter receptor subunit TctC
VFFTTHCFIYIFHPEMKSAKADAMRNIAGALMLSFMVASTAAQEATNYPTRPIRMIVPFAPGGSSDFVGRVLQPHLTVELGQQIVIDNRSGAAGNLGVEVAARANPDGHTILFANVGTMAINPGLYPSFPVRPLRDLVAITEVADLPSILMVNTAFPPSSVKDLVEYAKARPGQINFAGTGSSNRLDTESFMRAAGIKMVHIPYKGGAGPAIIGLMGNETQVMFALLSSTVSFIKQGRLKGLAVTAPKRVAVLPDIPALPELGYSTLKNGAWQGVFAPQGISPLIVQRLFASTQKVMAHPDVRKRLTEGGITVVLSKSPAEFTDFVKAETDRFGSIIREAGITAD